MSWIFIVDFFNEFFLLWCQSSPPRLTKQTLEIFFFYFFLHLRPEFQLEKHALLFLFFNLYRPRKMDFLVPTSEKPPTPTPDGVSWLCANSDASPLHIARLHESCTMPTYRGMLWCGFTRFCNQRVISFHPPSTFSVAGHCIDWDVVAVHENPEQVMCLHYSMRYGTMWANEDLLGLYGLLCLYRGRLEQKKGPMCRRKRGRSAADAGGHAVWHLRQNTSDNCIIKKRVFVHYFCIWLVLYHVVSIGALFERSNTSQLRGSLLRSAAGAD